MDLVFRFARRITVLVQGTVLVEGPPEEERATARAPGLPRRARSCLASRRCARATGHGRARGRRSRAPERGALAVLGRNGVGKTTLLATIMGHTFHSGTMTFNGRPIAQPPGYERSKLGIGYVPQERRIFPSLSLEENLLVAARPGRWNLGRGL